MALEKKDITKVGQALLQKGQTEWPIGDDLQIVSKMSGNWDIVDKSGSTIKLSDLSAAQEKLIRDELNIKEGPYSFDENPLIPNGGMSDTKRYAKKEGKSEFDTNPLIPD